MGIGSDLPELVDEARVTEVEDTGEAASTRQLFDGSDPTAAAHLATDWARTPLGPRSTWPPALRHAVATVLPSRIPMLIWWGPQLVQIYNHAYSDLLGDKHPAAIGQPAAECWAEVWDDLAEMTELARRGEATYSHELPLVVNRRGYDEETFWTFSYSPIRGEGGDVEGVFVATTDATESVVRGRRLRTLRDLGAISSADARSVEQVLGHLSTVLARHPGKVAFAVARLESDRGGPLEVVATFGTEAAEGVELPGDPKLVDAVRADCETREEEAPPDGWPVPLTHARARVQRALHLPIVDRSDERVVAVLTLGVNPHRALDDDYRSFLDLMARQVSTAATDALAFRREHERATQLAQLDRVKNRFLQNVSHELRTPLTLIAGSHRSLAARTDLPDVVRRDVAVAERGAHRLTRLVDGLLDLARSDERALEPSLVPTDLGRLTEEIVAMFGATITKAGLDLRTAVAELPGAVLVDPEMWSQIVSNLLSNAYKFTEAGSISIDLGVEDEQVRLVVADTGIGMDPDEVDRAFERFHQVSGASPRTAEGAGIGLALVHDLVEIHGGTVRVDSVPGRGSAFTVRIPARTARAEEVDLAGALRRAWSLATEAATWADTGHVHRVTSGDGEVGAETILVVEDNADLRSYLIGLLEDDGWRVVAVGDVPSALALEVLPTLVLSDVVLPGVDGVELVRVLREQPVTAEVPIILLTALAGPGAATEGLVAGATDYLSKPFDADELLARVRTHAEHHLRRSEALREAGETIEGLEVALRSNRQIGAAIGIAMARHGLTQAEAFKVLSRASQEQNRKLREVADEVVFTGQVPI